MLLLRWPAKALGKENEDRLKVTQDTTPFPGFTGTGNAMETELGGARRRGTGKWGVVT